MTHITSFIPALFLLLALIPSVISTPALHIRDSPITLPIAKRFAESGARDIVARQQARARQLLSRTNGRHDDSIDITNFGSVYTTSIGIGSPPIYYDLLVDTGSSNTWVGSGKPYVKTKTSINTYQNVSVLYGTGDLNGTECIPPHFCPLFIIRSLGAVILTHQL